MTDANARRGWRSLGTLPAAATAVTAIVAAYILLVAVGNITDYDTNQAFVQGVLSMDTTFNDPDVMWRAITNQTAQNAAYIAIIIWETVTAVVLIWATVDWLRAIGTGSHTRTPTPTPPTATPPTATPPTPTFDRPRRLSTIGFTMMLLLFGGGFITIGGEWFAMWQSEQWNGLGAAIQNFAISAFGLILVHLPSHDWGETVGNTNDTLAA